MFWNEAIVELYFIRHNLATSVDHLYKLNAKLKR